MLTVLSGGTGTPKLLQGLVELVDENEITVIVNTGEDVEVSGLKVSPDLDAVIYTLAGLIDENKWYGVRNDSYRGFEMLRALGHDELLKMGDRDRAVKLYRTMRIERGDSLSAVTRDICSELGVDSRVYPMTDDRVTTRIVVPEGELSFHEFWVERGGDVEIEDVEFIGSDEADPAPGVVDAIENSDIVLIGPSNPITSIGPIISIDEIRKALKRNRQKNVAVSPIIGSSPVSGPTDVLMRGLDLDVNPSGVAKVYEEFVGTFFLHEDDDKYSESLVECNMKVLLEDIFLPDFSSRRRLAKSILEDLEYL
ncbi:MAG: 2-phospho-L-lactate transferase [Candidatus Hadarchaeia archaeon]